MGYPTMVIFNAAGKELTRIPNGLDIQAYASILQLALANLTPIETLLTKAEQTQGSLSIQECKILANHSWLQDQNILEDRDAAQAFYAVWQACPSSLSEEKAVLYMFYLAATNMDNADTHFPTYLTPSARNNALKQLYQYLNNTNFIHNNLYAYLGSGAQIVALLTEKGSSQRLDLLSQLDHALETASTEQLSTLTRIQMLRGRIEYALIDNEAPLTEEITQQMDGLVAEALATDKRSPSRHATINGIGNMLNEAGQHEKARDVLSNEAEHSKYAYYYMLELAAVEQALGNNNAALQWLEKAYSQSRGPATRFQWGYNYLSGLLDMDGDNLSRIDEVFEQLFTQLTQSQAFHQRSKARLTLLADHLLVWATNKSRSDTLTLMHSTANNQCNTLKNIKPAFDNCQEFVQAMSK